MELCTLSKSTPSSLQPHLPPIYPPTFRVNPLFNRVHFTGVSRPRSLLRATSDETSSSGTSKFSWDTSDPVATLPSVNNDVSLDKVSPVNQSAFDETKESQPTQDESSPNESMQSINEFLEKFNIKIMLNASVDILVDPERLPEQHIIAKPVTPFCGSELDLEDPYPIILYGGGALVALWLLSAIVGAIDSIPVFPKLMEIIGLGYSVWFTTRFLLFKKNRQELGSKIDQLKQEVLGTSDD